MGWSISPDTGLVSIDQNGVLSYQEHTSDVTYTISYSDSEGCSTSKSVTIYGCTPCSCTDLTVTGKTDISKDGGDNITIGTLSKDSCMSNPRASSSESWLSNITVSGNDIKATVETNTGDTRNGSVTVTVDKEGGGTCDKTMGITQIAGGGECPFPGATIQLMLQIKYHKNYPIYALTDEVIGNNCIDTVLEKGGNSLFDPSVIEPGYGSFGYVDFNGCVGSAINGQYLHILIPGETGKSCKDEAEIRNINYGQRLVVSGILPTPDGYVSAYLGEFKIPTADEIQQQAIIKESIVMIIFSDKNNP